MQSDKISDKNSNSQNKFEFQDSQNVQNLAFYKNENFKSNDVIDFNADDSDIKVTDNLRLLGELLGYLRKNKYMSLLMICRRISKINVSRETICLEFENQEDDDIFDNENHLKVLSLFFKERGLDLKRKEKEYKESDAEILNKLLGGKLVIKHS